MDLVEVGEEAANDKGELGPRLRVGGEFCVECLAPYNEIDHVAGLRLDRAVVTERVAERGRRQSGHAPEGSHEKAEEGEALKVSTHGGSCLKRKGVTF